MAVLKFLSQSILVALITVLALEITLRIYAAFPRDADRYIHDEKIGYRARPNFPVHNGQTTNSGGFNDSEYAVKPRKGSVRLAIVGDSFVYGAVARKHNFTHVLEDLAQRNRVELEVLNMGISAAGPRNYLGLIRQDVANSNVDIVAVTIFVGNDITQAHPHFKTSVWLNGTRETLAKPYLVGLSCEYSYVYRSIRSVARIARERLDKTPRKSFTRENFMAIERQRSAVFKKDISRYVRDSYDGLLALIDEMSEEVKRQNGELIVLLAPDELQISEEIQHHLERRYQLDPLEYDFEQPQAILGEALEARGIAYLDLLPFFQEAQNGDELYIQYDTHWNEQGNRLAAEAIWRFLSSGFLL